MKQQAYLGWINYLLTPMEKNKQKMSLEKWFENFGFKDKKQQEMTSESVGESKKKSLEIAEKIVKMDKKGRRK